MIVAEAGRRIDAPGAQPSRFPLARRKQVRQGIEVALRRLGATVVVSSAACGADLLTLAAARKLGLRRRIVLPYRADWFLTDSVTDRPGRWKALYETLIAEAEASGDLITLKFPRGSDDAFRAANETIVREAQRLARQESKRDPGAALAALIVWEGAPRGPDDITAHLMRRLEAAGARVEQTLTLPTRVRQPELARES